jgi:hypothetical protein
MKDNQSQSFPRWAFVFLAVGGSWASGLYLGMQMVEGSSTAYLIRIIGFGALALVMAWGAIAKRQTK